MNSSSVQLYLLPISVFAGSQFLNPSSALRSLHSVFQADSVWDGESLEVSPFPFSLSLGLDPVPGVQHGDALRSREGSRVQALVPSLAQGAARPLCGGGCAWRPAAVGERKALSKCSTASVFLGTFKLHENDFRKQKHVLLAKYCVKRPENRSGWEESFLGRVEGEEEGDSCVFFTALKQHLSQLTMYLRLTAYCLVSVSNLDIINIIL